MKEKKEKLSRMQGDYLGLLIADTSNNFIEKKTEKFGAANFINFWSCGWYDS